MRAISFRREARGYWRSSSFQMAMLFTLLLGGCVGVLGYVSASFTHENFIASIAQMIDSDFSTLSQSNISDVPDLLGKQKTDGKIYFLRGTDGRKLAGNIDDVPPTQKVVQEGTISFFLKDKMYAAKIHLFDDGRLLLVGTDITKMAHDYDRLRLFSLVSIVLMLIVIGISFLISFFVVTRTNRIAATARHIMDTGDLSQRIAVDSRWDDLGSMAAVLNLFLENIERLMSGVRQVSDNIAHDLRTPLTRVAHDLQSLSQHPAVKAQPDLQGLTVRAFENTQRLLDTFHALLRIARIESGSLRQNFRAVSLAAVLADVVELYEPVAQDKNVSFVVHLQADLPMQGDPDLLFQALANIVDNAIKFSPQGGVITVSAGAKNGRNHVTIADQGQGIADSDKAKVFDRFYRADASRTVEGNGLGLALVAAVVDLHQGSIDLRDHHPGLCVEIIL